MPASTDLKRLEVEYGTGMDAFDRLPGSEDNRFQSEAAFERCRKDDPPIPARKPLLVLAEDPLVNQSPCVSIPKKHKSIFNWKPAPLEPVQPKQVPRILQLFFYILVLRRGEIHLVISNVLIQQTIVW